jgi:hypothetical protein
MQKTTDEKKAQRIAAYFAMLEEPVQVRAGDDFYRRLHFRLHSHAAESTSERKWSGLLRTALMVSHHHSQYQYRYLLLADSERPKRRKYGNSDDIVFSTR